MKLLTKSDMATRWDVSRQVVHNWEHRHDNFPKEVMRVDNERLPLYNLKDVKKYEEERGIRMKQYKNVGQWWADKNIELVEIDNEVYALNGWNGEAYLTSWKVLDDELTEASEDEYRITPIYDDNDEIIEYEIN